LAVALSVVVPCRDEARSLPELIPRIHDSLRDVVSSLEIIVIDDGSKDETAEILVRIAADYPELRWVRLSRNFGKEAAILAGLEAAHGGLIAVIDGDLQQPPEVLAEMVSLREETGADQVVGVRSRAGESRFRRWTSRKYGALLGSVSDVDLPGGYGDFRLVTRRVRDAVVSLPEATRFSRGIFAWVGFPTVAVRYADVERTGASSRWTPTQLMGYGLDGILSFSSRPLRFLIVLGAVFMGLFFVYVLVVVARVVLFGIDAPGYATLIAAVFFVGGMQAFSAGMLGEYLGRIFLEVKKRPAYVVMESGGSIEGQG
jgi:glycosyltransferase involved in cell wall biosynthesis